MPATYEAHSNGSVIEEMTFVRGMPELEIETDAGMINLGALAEAVAVAIEPRPVLQHDSSDNGCAARSHPPEYVSDLADSLARAISESAREQQERFEGIIQGLMGSISQLTEKVSSLQEADTRHESAVAALYHEIRETSVSIAAKVDALAGALDVQQQELSALQSTVSEV